jgi:acetyl-CoA synthetase
MPMIPEAAIAMLACARLGAPHTVVFGGFSAEALADRIKDCEGEGRDHRRRRLAARRDRAAQGQRRSGASRARRSSSVLVVEALRRTTSR